MKLSSIAPPAVRRSLAILLLLLGSATRAETLPTPTGEVILTVSGSIAATNGDGIAEFDLAMLRALPSTSISTTTIWTDGKRRFDGVSLSNLLNAVGATGGRLLAKALNDYAVEIPLGGAEPNAPIIAYELDGMTMSVRNKGPLWIIYPYDSDSRYRSEKIYSRSIWQLNRIEVLD